MRDPEQLRADIGRWQREIRTCRQRLGLTDDHPTILARLNRIALAQHLLDQRAAEEPQERIEHDATTFGDLGRGVRVLLSPDGHRREEPWEGA